MTTNSHINLLKKIPLFRGLEEKGLQRILETAVSQRFDSRTFLFHQGETANNFYVILEGNIRLTQITPKGRQVIIRICEPGDPLAALVLLSNNPQYPLSAEAITKSKALSWNRQATMNMLEYYPQIAINGMKMVANRFWDLQAQHRELATERVEQRVALAILRLIKPTNNRNNNHNNFPKLTLTRQDLAEMTGTTAYTVSRICSQWEQQGILETGREKLTILDLKKMEAIGEDLPRT